MIVEVYEVFKKTPNKMTEQAHALVVMPHPDDVESRMGGTVARWTREGKDVIYVVCTNGDKGTNDPVSYTHLTLPTILLV